MPRLERSHQPHLFLLTRTDHSLDGLQFFSKAVALWTGKDDDEHIYTVGGYLHYGGNGLLSEPAAVDLRPQPRGKTDPLYAIYARRL